MVRFEWEDEEGVDEEEGVDDNDWVVTAYGFFFLTGLLN